MTTVKKKTMMPVHPGNILDKEFLKPLDLNQNRFAVSIGISVRRINEIILERRKVTVDTALRLGRCFGMSMV